MTDSRNRPEPEQTPSLDDQRLTSRYFARAKATIMRETDRLRIGISAKVYDLSIIGLGLKMTETPPELREVVKVTLENTVQRVKRDVRGIVRHVTRMEDGSWRVGVELLTRLSPLEVSLLKMTRLTDSGEFPIWV